MKKQHITVESGKNRLREMHLSQQNLQDAIPFTSEQSLLWKRLNVKNNDGKVKPSIRLYFIHKLHQYVTGFPLENTLDNDLVRKIGVVAEYCITLLYLDNHLQDHKFGVHNEKSRERNREDYTATKILLDEFVKTQFNGITKQRISQTVSKLFASFEVGMNLDDKALTYEAMMSDNTGQHHKIDQELENMARVEEFVAILNSYKPQKFLPIKQQNYLRLLLTRAYLLNAAFYQLFAELIIDLFGDEGKDYSKLICFSRTYGLAQQLVNDNCDYLPVSYGYTTVCKLPEDTFSDLRRRLITLPILLFFQDAAAHKGELFEWYSAKHSNHLDAWSDGDQRYLLQILKGSKALGKSQGLVCALAAYGKEMIADPIFENMFSFVRGNRYYKAYAEFG